MIAKNLLLSVLALLSLGTLTGCDYLDKIRLVDDLSKQQEEQKNKIALLEEQQAQQKSRIDAIEKHQTSVINGTKTLATMIKGIQSQQDAFVFTEFNPAQTKYFIINNGSVALAGRILSIDAADNGSLVHISLVNLLSVPISNIGFHATWGGEKPTDVKALARWQQLLFSTSMNSTLQLLPGQWQDVNLLLKGISPNNLKYLKLAINMQNIQFENIQPAENLQKKYKR